LSWHDEQRRFSTRHRHIDVARRDNCWVERYTGEEERVFVPVVNRGDDIIVTRPQHNVRAGAPSDDGERSSPGTAPDDRQPLHSPDLIYTPL
jgi:hypothetical protein